MIVDVHGADSKPWGGGPGKKKLVSLLENRCFINILIFFKINTPRGHMPKSGGFNSGDNLATAKKHRIWRNLVVIFYNSVFSLFFQRVFSVFLESLFFGVFQCFSVFFNVF